jgi:hypothetical protein
MKANIEFLKTCSLNTMFLKNNKKFISKGLLILSIDVIVNDFSIGEKWFI